MSRCQQVRCDGCGLEILTGLFVNPPDWAVMPNREDLCPKCVAAYQEWRASR